MKSKRILASLLCISLLASCSGCGKKNVIVSKSSSSEAVQIQESDAANSIQMEGTEGEVTVTDDQGKDHTPEKDMNLYVDYSVATREESLAWMEADETRLYAMGPSSEVGVEETGRNMKMRVNEGTFFFAYTEPLDENESAEFYTNLTCMSIRGTCGIIQAISDTETEIQILEGNVTVKTLNEDGETIHSKSVVTGQQIVVQKDEDGNITARVEHIDLTEIPDYVYEEIKKNADVKTLIINKTGDEYLDYIPDATEAESATAMSETSNGESEIQTNTSSDSLEFPSEDEQQSELTEDLEDGVKSPEETEAIIRDYGFGDIWKDRDTGEGYSNLTFDIDGTSVVDKGDYYLVKATIYKPISISGEEQDHYSFIIYGGEELNLTYAFTRSGVRFYSDDSYPSDTSYHFSTDHLVKGEKTLFTVSYDVIPEKMCEGMLKISKNCRTGTSALKKYHTVTYEELIKGMQYMNGLSIDDDGLVTNLLYMGD